MGWRWWLRVGTNETARMDLHAMRQRAVQEAFDLIIREAVTAATERWAEVSVAFREAVRGLAVAFGQMAPVLRRFAEAVTDAGLALPHQGPCPDPEYDPGPWLRGDQ